MTGVLSGIRLSRCIRAARTDQSGAAVVEFAILLPILTYALLATVDIGSAAYDRLAMQHVIRAGAQTALQDPGESPVYSAMRQTAAGNFTLAAETGTIVMNGGALRVTADRFCACPNAIRVEVACTTVCDNTTPTYIYYDMTAQKQFSGILLPAFFLTASIKVQVR